MLTPRLERNLAAVSKSGTLSPQTHSVGLHVEGDRTREKGREGKRRRREKPPAEWPRQSRPAAARPRGLAPPTGIQRQTEKMPPLPQTPGGAGGTLTTVWRTSQPVGMGWKELGCRHLHHQVKSGVSDSAQGFIPQKRKYHTSSYNFHLTG